MMRIKSSILLSLWICISSACGTLFTSAAHASQPSPSEQGTIILLVGASGEEDYGQTFAKASTNWLNVANQAGFKSVLIGRSDENPPVDLEHFKKTLEGEAKQSDHDLWIVLLGHGTFDGKLARFNLRGPDLTSADLTLMLKPFQRPLVFVNCTSASAPFLNALSGTNRVIVTATKSGFEQNYARFGSYMAQAIVSLEADVDKDGQTSLLEAFLSASRNVSAFYENEGRLATEQALLDDNGDGKGTPASWFSGIRAVKKASDGALPDGLRAHQFYLVRNAAELELPNAVRVKRDQLELDLAKLRESKDRINEADYYKRLEAILLEIAELYANQAASKSPPQQTASP